MGEPHSKNGLGALRKRKNHHGFPGRGREKGKKDLPFQRRKGQLVMEELISSLLKKEERKLFFLY